MAVRTTSRKVAAIAAAAVTLVSAATVATGSSSAASPTTDAVPAVTGESASAAPGLRVTPSSSQVRLGETLAFVAEISNTGTTDLLGLRVAGEPADEVTTLLGARTDRGVFDPTTSTWFVDRLPAGATATLEIFARAETTGTARIVLVAATDEPTPTFSSADASVAVASWQADDPGSTLNANLTAGLLLTGGGGLVVVAGLAFLNRRRHDDAGVTAQVASDPE